MKISNLDVGILNFLHSFFVKVFEPSSLAAILLGPKTLILITKMVWNQHVGGDGKIIENEVRKVQSGYFGFEKADFEAEHKS